MTKSKDSKSTASPPALLFNEANAKQALIDAMGDIFIAASWLGITAMRLRRAIEASALLQVTLETLRQRETKVLPTELINKAIEDRLAMYRVAGLDALHELASIPVTEKNSAKLQVKLAAAARLAGDPGSYGSGDGLADTLRELNQSYAENAPRLRIIREKVTIETVPAERVVSGETKP